MENKYLYYDYTNNNYCCGIMEIGDFWTHYEKSTLAGFPSFSPYAFIHASFVNTPDCKLAYEKLKDEYNLIYQSPVRRNPNSGNNLFMCVYTPKKEKR